MGAGAVKVQPPDITHSPTHSPHAPPSTRPTHSPTTMSCDSCKANFTLFKRKRICSDCEKTYCSACLNKQPRGASNQRRCSKCHVLSSGNFTRHDLQKMSSKFMRAFLARKGVDTVLCTEKNDLIELALRFSHSSQHFREQRASRQHTAHLESYERAVMRSTGVPPPLPPRHQERMRTHATDFQPAPASNSSSPQHSTPSHTRRSEGGTRESGTRESGTRESGTRESGTRESGTRESGTRESGTRESGTRESGTRESGTRESGTRESGTRESGTRERGTRESGTRESETEAERAERLRQRQQAEMAETEARLRDELQAEEVETRPRRKHASIDELKAEGDIDELTVRQLKEILATNYVDYKGCVEKWELVDRVKRLWEDSAAKRQISLEMGDDGTDANESDLCKVCMDAVIDCVLLECGHMLTCTKCGRQLAECPICRQYVTRVVHTFRA